MQEYEAGEKPKSRKSLRDRSK